MVFKKIASLTKSSDKTNTINEENTGNKLRAGGVDPRERYQRHRHYHYGAGIGEGLPKVQRYEEAFLGVAPQQQRQIMAAAYAGTTQGASRNTSMNVYDDTYFSIIGLIFACLGFVMIVLLLFTPNNNHTHNKLVASSLEAGGGTTGSTIGTSNSGSEQGGCGGGSMKGSICNSSRVTSRLRVGSRSLKKKQDDFPYYDSDYEYDTDVVDLDLGNTTFNEHLIINATNLKPPALTHRAPSTSGGSNPNSITATTSNSITSSATATTTAGTTTTSTTNNLIISTAVSTCLTGTGPTPTRQKTHVVTTQLEPSSQHHNANSFLHHPGLSGFLADQSIDVDCSFEEEEDEGEQGSIIDDINDDNCTKIHTITTTATIIGSGATSLLRNRKLSQNISTTLDHQGDFSSSSSSPVVSNTNLTPYIPSLSLLSTPIASIAPQEHHRPIPVYTSSYSRSNSTNSEGSYSSSDDNNNLPSVEHLLPSRNSRKSPVNFPLPSDYSGESGISSNHCQGSASFINTSSPHYRSKDNILTYAGEETPRMHNQNREKQTHLKSNEVKEKTENIISQSKRVDPSEIGIDGWDFAYTSWNTEKDHSLSNSNSVTSIPEALSRSPSIPFVPDLILQEDQVTPLAEFHVVEGDIMASSNINSDKIQHQQEGWTNSIEDPCSATTDDFSLPLILVPSVQQQQQQLLLTNKQQPMSGDTVSNQQKLLKEALLEVSSAAISNPRAAASTIQHKRSNLVEENSDSTTSLTGNIKYKDLNIIEVIGGGGFGVVYKATWLGTPVAVKMLNYTSSRAVIQEFAAEINLLSGMRHPNICLYIGACLEPSNLAIVTELAVNGSLWDALRLPLQCGSYTACDGITFDGWVATARENANHSSVEVASTDTNILAPIVPPMGTWPWSLVIKVASGMARGMAYLHSGTPSILHRDLKSANILLDESYTAKVCDFGLSRLKVKDKQRSMTGNCGTVQWMAPEVLANEKYAEPADVYSCGIILWELLSRECPYEGMEPIQCAVAVLNRGIRPDIPNWCPPPFAALISRCVAQEAEARPTFMQILSALDAMPN